MMDNGLFGSVYNPDVLSCLANLSNDEVFTPPEVANQMLDMLPKELFENPETTFLDPACKSGVFLREIAKRLLTGLEPKIPDLQERIDHIYHKQLFGIAITELTSLLSRRGVYCSKYPNSKYSVTQFDNGQGNIRFKRIPHTWKDGKCVFCGASEEEYDRGDILETHAYEFIHTYRPEEILGMKFDVIVGNPPYQLSDGGQAASAKPLYNLFVEQSLKLSPRYMTMIIPARWYAGGKGLDSFREKMLSEKSIRKIVDFPNSSDCFPGVNIAGGVCYFLWDKSYNGDTTIVNMSKSRSDSELVRPLDEFPVFVRNNTAIKIIREIRKYEKDFYDSIVKSYSYFTVRSYERGAEDRVHPSDVVLLSSKGKGFYSSEKIRDTENILGKYKVIITYAMSGGNKPTAEGNYQVISSLQILKPNEVCTETYLVLDVFDDKTIADNMMSYVQTKFFRFLMLQALTSIHITKDSFCYVPIQDFSKPWTDKELYAKYGLTEEEIAFIESMIKPMEIE